MRKIKTLMAIFLSLFVMVILQSCEKERVEVTGSEQEHEDEIITADKLLEREGAVYLHLQRNWGTYYVTDEYTDVTLADGYYIEDIYICSTKASSVYARMSGCVVVPADLNMGYWGTDKYSIFLVLDIKRYTEGMSCVNDLELFDCVKSRPNRSVLEYFAYSQYHVCKYIPADRWVNKRRLSFSIDECNLNRGTDNSYIYLRYKTGSKEGAIRALRIAYDCKKSFNGSLMESNGFDYYSTSLNSRNRSLTGVYLGWK
jgi:hypothetical protein